MPEGTLKLVWLALVGQPARVRVDVGVEARTATEAIEQLLAIQFRRRGRAQKFPMLRLNRPAVLGSPAL